MPILIPILQGLRLFENLPATHLRELSQVMNERRVERREVVIKRGDRDAGLGFLIEGRQSISRWTAAKWALTSWTNATFSASLR